MTPLQREIKRVTHQCSLSSGPSPPDAHSPRPPIRHQYFPVTKGCTTKTPFIAYCHPHYFKDLLVQVIYGQSIQSCEGNSCCQQLCCKMCPYEDEHDIPQHNNRRDVSCESHHSLPYKMYEMHCPVHLRNSECTLCTTNWTMIGHESLTGQKDQCLCISLFSTIVSRIYSS